MTNTPVRLDVLPDNVRESALALSDNTHEPLVGWKAITAPDPGNPETHSVPIRYMVITATGYYEIDLAGLVVRGAVLHAFADARGGN